MLSHSDSLDEIEAVERKLGKDYNILASGIRGSIWNTGIISYDFGCRSLLKSVTSLQLTKLPAELIAGWPNRIFCISDCAGQR